MTDAKKDEKATAAQEAAATPQAKEPKAKKDPNSPIDAEGVERYGTKVESN